MNHREARHRQRNAPADPNRSERSGSVPGQDSRNRTVKSGFRQCRPRPSASAVRHQKTEGGIVGESRDPNSVASDHNSASRVGSAHRRSHVTLIARERADSYHRSRQLREATPQAHPAMIGPRPPVSGFPRYSAKVRPDTSQIAVCGPRRQLRQRRASRPRLGSRLFGSNLLQRFFPAPSVAMAAATGGACSAP